MFDPVDPIAHVTNGTMAMMLSIEEAKTYRAFKPGRKKKALDAGGEQKLEALEEIEIDTMEGDESQAAFGGESVLSAISVKIAGADTICGKGSHRASVPVVEICASRRCLSIAVATFDASERNPEAIGRTILENIREQDVADVEAELSKGSKALAE